MLANLLLSTAVSEAMAQAPAADAQARGWVIEPRIAVRETYNDNVSLSAAPERGELITQISPGISIRGRGPRLSGTLDYTADALFYSRTSENDSLFNTLSAAGNLEAVENFLFVDALGSISQQFISPFGARPADITTVTGNRVETRTWSVSPYVRGQALGGHTYELRNRNTVTTSNQAEVAEVHTQDWSASLASPITRFGWSIDGSSSDISYDDPLVLNRPDNESSSVRGRLFFQPDFSLRLWGIAGYEKNNYALGQVEQAYDIYGYGLRWQPTPRTTLEYEWEQRFFGEAPRFNFSHRTRLTSWTASYSKDDSSYQQEVLRIPAGSTAPLLDQMFLARFPDPAQRRDAVDRFMRSTGTPASLTSSLAFYSQQVLLVESLQGSVAILGAHNSIAFAASRSRSSTLTQTPPGVPADILLLAGSVVEQESYGLSASHRLAAFTSIGASAVRTYSRAEDPPLPESKNDFYTVTLSHTVSPKTTAFGGASYSRFESPGSPTAHARSVFAGLEHRF